MSRTSQVATFVTRAPAARPVALAARPANGGGGRTTSTGGGRGGVTIQGAQRVTRVKGGKG